MAQNATCDRETLYNLGNVSQSLSMFAVIYAAVAYTTFVVGYSVWYRYRKVPYLNSRDVPLLFISTCAVALATFSGLTSRHLGDVVPCELFVICYLYAFPGAAWPLMVRLIIWVNKIKFNFAIAAQVAKSSLQQINTHAKELQRERLLASLPFALFLTFIVLVPYFIATVVMASATCSSCANLDAPSYFLFLPMAGCMLLVSIGLFVYYREVPDTFLLWRETAFTYFAFGCLAGPGLILGLSDIGDFNKERPRMFDWGILVDLGYFASFVIAVPMQIYFAKIGSNCWKRKQYAQNPFDGLKELLSTKRGTEFFSMYLATTLSLETILFYLAVREWRHEYDDDPKLAETTGTVIYNTYIKKDSQLEVNVGVRRKAYLANVFERRIVTLQKDVFNDAAVEVFKLMANNHFRNFERSDFYKLYTGELQPNKMTWVKSSGFSSFHYLQTTDGRISFV